MEQERRIIFTEEKLLPIGTFKLSDLLRAHESVDPGQSGYEVVTNNCANYMVALASALGVKITLPMTAFVTHRLLEQSGHLLVERIRNSANYFLLFPKDRNLRGEASDPSEEQVIELLVAELVEN